MRGRPPAVALITALAGCPGGKPVSDGGPTLIITVSDGGQDAGPDGGETDAGPLDAGCPVTFVVSGQEFVAPCGNFNYGSGVVAAALGPTPALDVAFWNIDELTPSPQLNVLANQGDGGLVGGLTSYSPFGSSADGGSIVSVAAGDFNGDGQPDLAAIGQIGSCAGCPTIGQLAVLFGDGQGNLGSPSLLPWPNPAYSSAFMGPQSLAAADLDGDGRSDLAAVMLDDTAGTIAEHLVVLLTDGGLPSAAGDYPLSEGAWQLSSVVTADLDGDGLPDLAVAARELYVLRNQGRGTFAGPTAFATEIGVASWLAAADFDGDGRVDLAVGSYLGSGPLGPAVQVFRNDGDGGFVAGPAVALPADAESYGAQLAAADFDGDARADAATICQLDGGPVLVVLPGLPDGGLGAPQILPCGLEDVAASGAALIAAQVRDASPDLVVGAPRLGDNCTKVTALYPVCE